MNDNPLVTLITVNYNQPEVTCDFLKSMRKVTYPNTEIIVVDNGSKIPIGNLEQEFPEIVLIKSQENLGFAGGNNLGIKAARGKYLLFINNDTEVEPDFLEPMVHTLEQNKELGIVSPKIKYFYHPELIQYAGFSDLNPFTLRMHADGYMEKDEGQHDRAKETFFAHGCAMMIPRRVIDAVGMMPEVYFLYYEEHDWSTRIKNGGYKIYYQPKSTVWHKESISTGKDSTLKTYYINRNRLLFWRRNITGPKAVLSLAYLSLIAIPKIFASFIIARKWDHLKAFSSAVSWHLKSLSRSYQVSSPGS